ncbi:MAG: hypothetical protein NT169_22270 [Chloroflexi bacterium]|nr:hypothetical protein [Chloroflexota bacterium]
MTHPTPNTCPHLGLAADRTLARTQPDTAHRCSAQTPPGTPDAAHQAAYCLAVAHTACPFYVEVEDKAEVEAESQARRARTSTRRRMLAYLPWIALALLLIVVAVVYGRDLLRPPAALPPGSSTLTPDPSTLTPVSSLLTPDPGLLTPATRLPTPTSHPATATPEPGGQVLVLAPKAGEAGWWTSGEARGNHLGDSYLYAGYFSGQAFVAAARFELARVPRGAAIREATLRLTGLRDDRFRPEAGGTWQVQLLAADAVKEFARTDFQTLFNAPAAVTLFPAFYPVDLDVNRMQELRLDASGRAWLAEQIAAGAATVIVRITGPAGGDTLFAWDSGAGPASGGNGPQIALVLAPAPATPPPLPTERVLVATLTPTPANVLTAAARVVPATTGTPVGYRIVTPTPPPANLATAQAQAVARGLPPVVPSTATPANEATATANAAYATAVAVTTGTFTPVPTNAITPVMIPATPVPENIATAAAQALAATARAPLGTPTPLPYNALIVTLTPRPFEVTATPTAANAATAIARSEYATAVAVVVGTFTPLPPQAIVVRATPVPLLIYLDELSPTPAPPPTPAIPATVPRELVGKILFSSDRLGDPRLFAFDPATDRLARVTQGWPFTLAADAEGRSPDGIQRLVVQEDARRTPQVYVQDARYSGLRQLTTTTGWCYDPTWSPRGDRIAFVSQEPGNDEIYLINPDGSGMQRLTVNTWEWDKHPSWSPDGAQIVFWSNRETGRRQLWVMNADGSGQRRLLDSPYNDWDPVWVK